MLYDIKRFIFSVSLCAMLAVNPVLATAPTNDEELGTTHDVYVESTLNQATNGIAGVSYVNRMVNAAGNAADAAEAHAAAAGAHALSAAQSAAEAHEVLADKVNIEQGADKKNLAMVTDKDGSVYAGYISTDMIEKTDPTCYVNASGVRICSYENQVLISDDDGNVKWGQVANAIADGAVTLDKISSIYPGGGVTGFLYGNGSGNGNVEVFAVTGANPALIGWKNGAPIAVVASDSGGVLKVYGTGVDKGIGFAHITTEDIDSGVVTAEKIADGAVTAEKIADGAVTASKIETGTLTLDKFYTGNLTNSVILGVSGENKVKWGKITPDYTAGVVGMVPVGAEGATTYGSFWIE